jgi:Terminase small subunit
VPVLKSVRDEKFAQYVASGISQSEAYRRVSGKTANANNHGDDYMAKLGMKERIAEIRAENAAKCDMSKEEYRSYLISAMRTPAATVDPHHPFCQVYKEIDARGVTREWKTPDKLRAAQLLAQHCGWDEPTKVALDVGDSLSAFLREVVPK